MSVRIEIDKALLARAVVAGLVEFKDDEWQATPLGERVLREYCDRKLAEAGR